MRILAILGFCLMSNGLASAQQPPVDAFSRLPAMMYPTLSPDGRRLAYIANDGDTSALYILDIDSGDRNGIGVDEIRPHELIWANNDYLVMIASQADRFARFGSRNPVDMSAAFSVEATNPGNVVQLMRGDRQIHPQSLSLGNVVGIDRRNGDVMIPAYEAPRQSGVSSSRGSDAIQNPRNTLWRVEPDGSSVRREMQGLPEVFDWYVNGNGEPVGREYYDNERNTYRFHAYRDGDWATLIERVTPVLPTEVVGFFGPGEAVLARYINGYRQLQMLDVASGEETADVTGVPGRDVLETYTDPYSNEIVGMGYDDGGMRTAWFDNELQALQEALVNALGNESATLTSWSEDRVRFIVRTDNGDATPAFYLFDNAERSLSPLASEYPELEAVSLGNRQPYSFTTRDGTRIPGYVTMPATGGSSLPAVLLPHGGPESQDIGGFDYWAHFLASRGYVVIQPNFRGSEGFGLAHRNAGRGQWGTGITQTDILDAVDNLVEAGTVDADRVCIFGASYGGYAALAGGAFTPGRFACIAAYAPVSNVGLFLGDSEIAYGANSWIASYWRQVFGGEISADEREQLNNISPFYHARRFEAPVLMMHGRDDSRVPISQSRRMEDALDDAGVDVTYVELRDADHWLTSQETRNEVLTRLEAFLAEHIGD